VPALSQARGDLALIVKQQSLTGLEVIATAKALWSLSGASPARVVEGSKCPLRRSLSWA